MDHMTELADQLVSTGLAGTSIRIIYLFAIIIRYDVTDVYIYIYI